MDIISQFKFAKHVPMGEVGETLNLSILAIQNIHPQSKIQLDSWTRLDEEKRICLIDRSTQIGEQIAQEFISFINRAFGKEAFRHTRLRKRKSFFEPAANEQGTTNA